MSMLCRCVIIVCCLWATITCAQIDNWPDSIGLYFDDAGNNPCLDGAEGVTSLFIIISHITISAPVMGWACTIHSDYALEAILLNCVYGYGGINHSAVPEFLVWFASPLQPPNPSRLVIARLDLNIVTPVCIGFSFGNPNPPDSTPPPRYYYCSPAKEMCEIPVPADLWPSTGYPGTDVAQLNCGGCGVITTDPISWGSIKGLYR